MYVSNPKMLLGLEIKETNLNPKPACTKNQIKPRELLQMRIESVLKATLFASASAFFAFSPGGEIVIIMDEEDFSSVF